MPELHVLYGPCGSGKTTFMNHYGNTKSLKVISRDMAMLIHPYHMREIESELSSVAINTVNDILSNNKDIDVLGIEIPLFGSVFYNSLIPAEFEWIQHVSSKFNKIVIHSFCDCIQNLNDIHDLVQNVVYVKHNEHVIFKYNIIKNSEEHFDMIYENIITDPEYIQFKSDIGYPDFIQLKSYTTDSKIRSYNRKGKEHWSDDENTYDDQTDTVINELCDILSIGNYTLPIFNFKQWFEFEQHLYFEICRDIDDYYKSGYEHITYLSLPDLYSAIYHKN